MTADPNEIAKFAQLESEWWDKEGAFKTLHDINPVRLHYIQQHVELKDANVLDLGCGGGILSESLWEAGADVTAIDMDEQGIGAAKRHQQPFSLSKVDYRCIDVTELAQQQPQHYDVITCLEMLEHVPDPAAIVKACKHLLKPQGHLFLSTINRSAKAYALAIIAAEYLMNIIPRGTHEYKKFLKPGELAGICRENKFKCLDLSGLHYNPFSRRSNINKDLSINYLLYARSE